MKANDDNKINESELLTLEKFLAEDNILTPDDDKLYLIGTIPQIYF